MTPEITTPVIDLERWDDGHHPTRAVAAAAIVLSSADGTEATCYGWVPQAHAALAAALDVDEMARAMVAEIHGDDWWDSPDPVAESVRENSRARARAIRAALLGDGTQDAQNQAQDGRTAPAGTPAAPDPAERLGDALRRLATDHTTEWSQHRTVTRLADEVDRLAHQADVGRRAAARARVLEQERDQAKAALERVRVLAESWRYKGEHGWGAWQEGEGPSPEGETLDHAAYEIRATLDGGTEAPPALTVERLTEAIEYAGATGQLRASDVARVALGWLNGEATR